MFGITDPINPVDQTPFQPWAKALYDDRQVHELEPHARCKASGTARQFQTPYGVEFVEMPELKRLYIFDIGGPHTFRTVYMDGRSHPARPRAELLRPFDRLVGRRHARDRQLGLQRKLLDRSPRHAAHGRSCTRSSGSPGRIPRRSTTRSRSTIPARTRPTGRAGSTCTSSATSSCSSTRASRPTTPASSWSAASARASIARARSFRNAPLRRARRAARPPRAPARASITPRSE